MRKFNIFLIILLLSSCEPQDLLQENINPIIVTLHEIKNGDSIRDQRLIETTLSLEEALNSPQFQKEFLKLKLENTNNKTNREVFQSIVNGAELVNPGIDNTLDLYISFVYRPNSMGQGMASPSKNQIYLNTHYFDKNDVSMNASTIFHEWLHNVGYSHSSPNNKKSVPYAGGNLVRWLIAYQLN